jgi:uncharacterized protein YjiS (DUF1127 family)
VTAADRSYHGSKSPENLQQNHDRRQPGFKRETTACGNNAALATLTHGKVAMMTSIDSHSAAKKATFRRDDAIGAPAPFVHMPASEPPSRPCRQAGQIAIADGRRPAAALLQILRGGIDAWIVGRTIRALRSLDDRMLKDVGIMRD